MKNKRTLLFAGILAAFLMLAVPFAIVSFESENSYATGESEVSGGEEQNTKPSYTFSDDGYALVGTYEELMEALNKNESKIRLKENITITESIIISYSMTLDGNGNSICKTEDVESSDKVPWKLLSIQGLDGSVTINNIVLETEGSYSRTLDISNCGKNATVYLNDCQIINYTHYPLYIGSDSVNVKIAGSGEEDKESELRGYCAIRINAYNASIEVINTKLTGDNTYSGPTSSFSTIMVDKKYSANITLENTDVTSIYENGVSGYQYAFYFYEGATGSVDIKNNVTFETLNVESPADTYFGAGDAVAIFNGTLKGKVEATKVDGAQTFSITGYEGNSLNGLKVYGDAISNDAKCNISVSNIKTADAGILVKNAGDVTISNCEVTGFVALEEDSKTNGGILVSQSNSATILNNIVTCDKEVDKKSFFGVGVQKVMSADISYNEIYGIDNAVWADMTLPNEVTSDNEPIKVVGSSVTINGNTLEWGSKGDGFDGRGIRSESYETVMINGNTFILNPNETIDVGNVAKITYTGKVQFEGNFIGGADKADCGIKFTDSTGKDVYVDIASDFGSKKIEVDGLWYLGGSIKCGTIDAYGNITIGSNFTAGEKISINTTGNLSIKAVDETNKLSGLTVSGTETNTVSITGINSDGSGILVSNAGSVTIENCTVSDVDQESVNFGGNIFGIGASNVNSITIVGCDINNVESTERTEVSGKDGIGIFLDQIKEEVIIGGQDDADRNTVVCTGHNAILITLSPADVTIQNNEISDWTSNTDKNCGSSPDEFNTGRALRIENIENTVAIRNNAFSRTYSDVLIDLGNVAKITGAESVSFSNNSMSGIGVLETISSNASEVFIDAGTIVVSPTFSKSSESAKYYCYGIKASGTVTIGEGADFILLRGGVLELSEGAALTGTVNGPDGARITFTGIVAGPGGATLTGGSIIAGGMFTSGSVTINTDGNVLDGTFDDVDLIIDDVEVEINDNVVFTNGTTVVLENGAKFTEDPVFEAGTKLIISSGSGAPEEILINETSKVSSSGVVRAGFYLPIICDNGSVYYRGLEVFSIEVFVGDIYGDYLDELTVKPNAGYVMFRWADDSGMPINDSQTIDEGDKLTAVCAPVPVPSEVEESAGFDIADYVVLIEAVIAVLVLIGFVAYIRKN